jgi:penicillin-binding protein 1A
MTYTNEPPNRAPTSRRATVSSTGPHLSLNRRRRRRNRNSPRLRPLRVLLVISGFITIAGLATMFGILTAMASELPQLQPQPYRGSIDSILYTSGGQAIGDLAPPGVAVDDSWRQISPNMVHAIISVEDKRFWTDPGIDVKGLIRAALSDVGGGAREGASTIPEEFVKVREKELDDRTIFEKLREALIAFQLVHHWKRITILTDYLNTIYFGNGANGIEAAARIYFGSDPNLGFNPEAPGVEPRGACGDEDVQDPTRPSCASKLSPAQAALLAGMVANPTAFNPLLHAQAALGRRQLVLEDMLGQHYITRAQYNIATNTPLPTTDQIEQPQEPIAAPYFTSWVTPLVIHAMQEEGVPDPSYEAYYGDLKIHLTLNEEMQNAAQQAVDTYFPPGSNGPTATLVAIDNKTGAVRAMVSGDGNYLQDPFNLATLGYRQPGSSFKLFTLALALEHGYTPDTIIDSKPLNIRYDTSAGYEHFIVHNFGNVYAGPISFQGALDTSDNSVFTQVGLHVGTQNIKQMAENLGIRSSISTSPAMILGGLTTGVSALDMAHAYSTVANGGLKTFNPILGDYDQGAIGIQSITGCKPCRQHNIYNYQTRKVKRELPASIAAEMQQMLEGVVTPGGTGYNAAIPGVVVAGKTGTTSNYVDAWFVGWTPQLTTAVWVGFPNHGIAMDNQYEGKPVEGGTFPALIWREFETAALQILANEEVQETGTNTIGTGTSTVGGETFTNPATVTQQTTNPDGGNTVTNPGLTTPGGGTTNPGGSTTPSGTTTSGGAGLGGG